ncbi:MAG: Ig-like domain-containing protein [Actinomycetota bacterium]|nr:Ig-like domain-containing protein [Actinomycetota bacterium]
MHDSHKRRGLRLLATAGLVLGALGLAAGPAQAVSVSGYGSGAVGITQVINVQDVCPSSELLFSVTYSNGTVSSANPVWADINGDGTIYWTPNITGLVTQASIGSTCTPVPLGGANISTVATSTTVNAPNNAQVGTATKIMVIVQSGSASSYSPTGTVVVKDINGVTLQTMGLTAGPGAGQAYAYYWWTPTSAGSYTFQATYSGDNNAQVSTSPQDVTIATSSGSPIYLSLPPTMSVGVPQTLKATVAPSTIQGSVGFTQNGVPISPSVPLINGVASYQWTPTISGQVQIGANYTSNQGASGSTSEVITMNTGPVATDVITLIQPGVGQWAPNGTYQLGQGTSITFQAGTLSGAAVTLSDTGPCTTSGLTLTVGVATGQCTVIARSAGGNGYAPVAQNYTVTPGLGTQTAVLNAPLSGKVKAKQTTVLQTAAQGETNAGQAINWAVAKSSRTVCALGFPSSGAVTLKFKKRGFCTVNASAPGIANQWSPFSLTRTYQGI